MFCFSHCHVLRLINVTVFRIQHWVKGARVQADAAGTHILGQSGFSSCQGVSTMGKSHTSNLFVVDREICWQAIGFWLPIKDDISFRASLSKEWQFNTAKRLIECPERCSTRSPLSSLQWLCCVCWAIAMERILDGLLTSSQSSYMQEPASRMSCKILLQKIAAQQP